MYNIYIYTWITKLQHPNQWTDASKATFGESYAVFIMLLLDRPQVESLWDRRALRQMHGLVPPWRSRRVLFGALDWMAPEVILRRAQLRNSWHQLRLDWLAKEEPNTQFDDDIAYQISSWICIHPELHSPTSARSEAARRTARTDRQGMEGGILWNLVELLWNMFWEQSTKRNNKIKE